MSLNCVKLLACWDKTTDKLVDCKLANLSLLSVPVLHRYVGFIPINMAA